MKVNTSISYINPTTMSNNQFELCYSDNGTYNIKIKMIPIKRTIKYCYYMHSMGHKITNLALNYR